MKNIYIVLGIFITILMIGFRFNVLGFYHEYIKGDTIDIGGYGKEEIFDVLIDGKDKYIVSVTEEYIDQNIEYEHILLTKLDNRNKVVWSKQIDLIDDDGYQLRVHIDNLVISNDILFFSTQFSYVVNDEITDYKYLVSYNIETKTINSKELNVASLDRSKTFIQDNHIYTYIFNSRIENSVAYLEYNLDFELINETTYELDSFSSFLDAIKHEDDLFILVDVYLSDYRILKIYKLNLVSGEFILIDYSENSDIYGFKMIIRENILYYSFPEDLWHQETYIIHKYNLNTSLMEASLSLDIPSKRNQLLGFNVSDTGDIYVYGWEDSPSHVDSVYYKYDSEGEYLDTIKYSIGGIDSIKNIYFSESEVILVISSKRIVDADYFPFSEYNPTYDNFLRFNKK
ncbi:MAG: hypothetical protein KQ78_02023 [Candidatus Izimaplasma bacterium HR2]|nr:MAG: hypothetical protein KQ78_02023 [Candidatus Izimaplasma bacterium HR2]